MAYDSRWNSHISAIEGHWTLVKFSDFADLCCFDAIYVAHVTYLTEYYVHSCVHHAMVT